MNKKNHIIVFFLCLVLIHNILRANSSNIEGSISFFSGYRYDSFFYHIDTYENQELILNNGLALSNLHSLESGLNLQLLIAKKFVCCFEGSYSIIQKGNFQEEVLTFSPFPYKATINNGNAYHFDFQAYYLVPCFITWSFGPELGFFLDRIKTTNSNSTLWNQPYPLLDGLKFNQTWKGFKVGCFLNWETTYTITQLEYLYLIPKVEADYLLRSTATIKEGFSDHRIGKSGHGQKIIFNFDIKCNRPWLVGIKGSLQKMQVYRGIANPIFETTFRDVVRKISWENAEILLRISYFF